MRFFVPILAFLLLALPAGAQLPGIPGLSGSSDAAPAGPAALPGAVVTFDSRDLFRVYARDPGRARDRAELLLSRMERARAGLLPRSRARVSLSRTGSETELVLDGNALISVTAEDELGYGQPAAQVASLWATSIETALNDALRERGPGFLRTIAVQAGRLLFTGALLTLATWFLLRRFAGREGVEWPLIVLIWAAVLYFLLELLPQTRPLHHLLAVGVLRPLGVALIVCLAAIILCRLYGRVLRRFLPANLEDLSPAERTERRLSRRATLVGVARVTGVTVIWVVAVIAGLSWAGVNLPALLASAGLIGVALGLAAQDWLKDIVAGINILADDRFGVGDVIQVGQYSGAVENLDLRVTQIRDINGRLITFSNRNIDTVANLTSRWSQVDFKVGVAYETDLRRAMEVVTETARALAAEWPSRILAPPEMLGVDSYNDSDITLRMLVRTAPGDQWPVARELRLRVKEAFDAAGITIPLPQRFVTLAGSEPAPPDHAARPGRPPHDDESPRPTTR